MLKRTITGALLVIGSVILFFYGGLPLHIVLGLLACIGLYELYRALSEIAKSVHIASLLLTVFYFLIIDIQLFDNVLLMILLLLLLSHLILLVLDPSIKVFDVFSSIFGFLYIPVIFSVLWMMRRENNGAYFIWLVFITAWGTDTGAYCFGKLFGSRKLAPHLSPNKTVEGALGGVFTASFLSLLFGIWGARTLPIDIEPTTIILACVTTGAVGSMLAQLGDLAASSIKRFTGVKDFGNIFPGHGGVLDRFDSILFTAPGVYLVISFFNLLQR